ncbi:hypothetical protein C7445_102218 [Alicyclobacillus sacchari]|uniref:Cytosolic protein n=1 Tax=Alicyclobacillus sacchari TaxID=392010 RepID=A0A4R8LT30_9BACL|nr:DUF6282 family protein [Alicyclobacillus sacchari]TDY50658.1 hypothetical protein C7445_102218 [Alicyclobacillus sacchari]GMA55628.1 hypothetical protein GCM10025858_01310 [Alicyclobacillus sacchari]
MSQSEHIIRLLSGAYDLHVHVWPDLVERSVDDVTLAHQFSTVGWRGFALKSHYFPTVERAKVVSAVVPGVDVIGTIALNHTVGGFNPVAVDIAGRAGARIVWLPTVDASNESPEKQKARGAAHLPFWARIQEEVRAQGIQPTSLSVLDERGQVRDDVKACLELIRQYKMVLATGHLARDEIFAVVETAREIGVDRVIVTHALFPSQALSIADQVRLAEMGAVIEHCYTTFYTSKCDWKQLFDAIHAVGPERTLLSTDLGQKTNPGIVDGLMDYAARLLAASVPEADVRKMLVDNPARLISL